MKIYALMSGQLVLYVGKTGEPLSRREARHRNKWNGAYSKYIPDWIDWEIKLLEEVPDDQGTAKEQHYYDTLKPLYNRNRPGQTAKDREQSEAMKKTRKEYRSRDDVKERKNTPEYKEWRKQYRDTDEERAKRAEGMRRLRAARKATQSQSKCKTILSGTSGSKKGADQTCLAM